MSSSFLSVYTIGIESNLCKKENVLLSLAKYPLNEMSVIFEFVSKGNLKKVKPEKQRKQELSFLFNRRRHESHSLLFSDDSVVLLTKLTRNQSHLTSLIFTDKGTCHRENPVYFFDRTVILKQYVYDL